MKNLKELGINDDFIKGLKELNIIEPTEIQNEVIPLLLNDPKDLIGQAQTGTGKTAAYGIPLLQQIEVENEVIQGLILCPTRELAQQVAKQLFRFTKYSARIFTESVYGGEKIDRQIESLKRPTHIVVATPGRLIDLIERKALDLSNTKTVILDEADEMLSMGFKKELDQILEYIPKAEYNWLFSATIPHGIQEIINRHMSDDAHRVEVSGSNLVNTKIEHQYLICEQREKIQELLNLLNRTKGQQGLVFCRTKAGAQTLAERLIRRKVVTDAIHGNLKQKERDKVMRAFKKKNLQILIATDVAARGIDIKGLSFVVHYNIPESDEYYTHRSGRTARAGKSGISLCLISEGEINQIRHFENVLGIKFTQVK